MSGTSSSKSSIMARSSYEDHSGYDQCASRHAGGVPADPTGFGAGQRAIERTQPGGYREDREVNAIAEVDARKPSERLYQQFVVQPIKAPVLDPPGGEQLPER